jgi:hypothetical protein
MPHQQDAEQNQNKETYYNLECDAIQSGRYIYHRITIYPSQKKRTFPTYIS